MQTVLIVLTVIVSVLLIAVVLVQKSKGGGLASNFAGSNQIMGVRRTTDFIEKTTWTLAAIILVISIVSARVSDNTTVTGKRFHVEAQKGTTTATPAAAPGAKAPANNAPTPSY